MQSLKNENRLARLGLEVCACGEQRRSVRVSSTKYVRHTCDEAMRYVPLRGID